MSNGFWLTRHGRGIPHHKYGPFSNDCARTPSLVRVDRHCTVVILLQMALNPTPLCSISKVPVSTGLTPQRRAPGPVPQRSIDASNEKRRLLKSIQGFDARKASYDPLRTHLM